MSVRPYWTYRLLVNGLSWNSISEYSTKNEEKIRVVWTSDRNHWYFTWGTVYVWFPLRMRDLSDRSFYEAKYFSVMSNRKQFTSLPVLGGFAAVTGDSFTWGTTLRESVPDVSEASRCPVLKRRNAWEVWRFDSRRRGRYDSSETSWPDCLMIQRHNREGKKILNLLQDVAGVRSVIRIVSLKTGD